MTRKEALEELIAKVEAGEAPKYTPEYEFALFPIKGMWAAYTAMDAYEGSLDAAKALHESVLPKWTMDQMNQWHEAGSPRGWAVHLLRHEPIPRKRVSGSGFDMPPARAWLLAILRALHDMEKE